MSGNLNTNNNGNTTPPTPNQQLMNMLMNPNAYKYAAGLLMTVWGNVSQEEMKVNMENAHLNSKAASMQSKAVKMQAEASIIGGVSGAVNSGIQGATGFVQAGMYTKNATDIASAQKELDAAKANASTAATVSSSVPITPNQTNSDVKVKEWEDKLNALQNQVHSIKAIGEGAQALSQAFGQLSKGFTDAAGSLAGNGASMFNQVEQELAANQTAANQTLQGVLQNMGSIGQVALAGARG